ncbi:MAG TPA: CPBP family intramembrane glutamic endopeptidase [Gemmatimonadota bacterium]|nr:CPBP family intramembrane glutamic endopeptidase [Gemmatimonadota bacterium]
MLREDAYPSLGRTAWLLAGTLLAALALTAAALALFPDWPRMLQMALPTELALVGAVAWGVRRSGLTWRRALGLGPLPLVALWPLALVLAGSVTVFSEIYVIMQRLVPVPPEFEALLRELLEIDGTMDLVLTVAVAVVVAPLLEEALFRGLILHGLARRRGPRSATLWTAAFFAFFHFYNPWQIIPTFFLGLLLGWVVLVTRSLWSSILLHSAFNGLSLSVFALSLEPPDAPPPLVATGVVLFLLLGSAALLAGLAWLESMTGGGAYAEESPRDAGSGDAPADMLSRGGMKPPARG